MKIMVNGVLVDATPEQEASILAFQRGAQFNQSTYSDAMQSQIDIVAMSKGYTNGFACAGYVTSTNPQWAAEAQAFVEWRDSVFAYGYDYLEKVQDGEITNPQVDVFISGIPPIVWPVTE